MCFCAAFGCYSPPVTPTCNQQPGNHRFCTSPACSKGMRASTLAACAALALLLGVAVAQKDYSCPTTCQASLGCQCASSKAPTSIANGDLPQFIVLTNDDAITVVSQPIILNVTERHTNKNGCKMPATWFVSIEYTDPALVKQVYTRGHEIATHTINHVANPNASQIVGARDWLVKTAGIPKADVVGFRAPFLIFDPTQRDVLAGNGFKWDSSISEQYPSTTSPSASERLWPYTMDYGIPQNCAISTGTCSVDERHPGLWEFPMWNVQDKTGATVASMDPLGDAYELYKQQFDERYSGNRAPLGIYIHAAWIIADPTRADRLNKFLEYATSQENVFLVTVSQVLDWMKNPVPASQYSPSCPDAKDLETLPNAGALCVQPNDGCDYGTFDSSACKCQCQNEEINAAGYCVDAATGRCTVQKDYDFTNKDYFCPKPTPASVPASAPAAGPAAAPGAAGTTTPASPSASQELSVEMDVTGTTPAEFTATRADAFCAQLLRLTGDSTATCTIVSVLSVSGRRLLQDKVHVIASITTKNAAATVSALQGDTVSTLLAPAGVSVVPGTVKAQLGAPVVPAPAPATATGDATTATPAAESVPSTGDATTTDGGSSSGGGGSNAGAIAGAVVGVIGGIALLGGGFWYWRRRKAAKADTEAVGARTASFNPTFNTQSGVTATLRTSRSPTKKQLAESEVCESPLRDSMMRGVSGQQQQE
ncbi:hypothetical protein D9Q98_009612 [Chlorella vulgaris]|uniref:NodB homology domain-containing protein n=1 Tax=Chlorella vulgaris TaxID=3077 RepID=A0A9D4TFI3_CHLVU|nr:hypothetical protein D9Q98_009612 [Chlorella vulgaris]